MTVPSRASTFDAARALRSLTAFGAVGGGLSVLGLTTGLGIPCPLRATTGLLCPLCGGTHLGMALLRGDLAAAWSANPFVFVGLIVLAGLGVLWAIEAGGGPAIRPPKAVRWGAGRWWALIGAGALIFAVCRNLS